MEDTIPQDTPQKQCPGCKEYKPATPEYFHRDKYKRSGLCPRCKTCEGRRVRTPRHHVQAKNVQIPASPLSKFCTKCNVDQPLEDFYRIGDTGLRWSQCKTCAKQEKKGREQADPQKVAKHYRNWKRNHPELAAKIHRNARLRYDYGMSQEQYEEMFYCQFGLCAICGLPSGNNRSLHVDHCHKTGIIRELICANCNFLLGHAKDDMQILENAIKYLKKHST